MGVCARIVRRARALLLLGVPLWAGAWPVAIHYRLPDVLSADPALLARAAAPADAGLERFRAEVYRLVVTRAPADLRARFLKRYPTAAAFHAEAFKVWLGMSAVHPALGFDPFTAVEAAVGEHTPGGPVRAGQERTLLGWVRIGSIYPDVDRRNQDRWLVVDGRIQRAADGERVPQDPVVLNMGAVEGLAGQAHAHYALNRNPKSDDPGVLKSRPADFAIRAGFPQAPVLTFAPERAQAYCDLTLIARELNQPVLAAVFAGAGFHYVADAASQIHTLQVGIYEFFVDAKLQSWKLELWTLGGLLGRTRDFRDIGLDILTNHHTWSEEFFRVACERAAAGKPISAEVARPDDLFSSDPQLEAAFSGLPQAGPVVLAMMEPIVVAGNAEGPEVYRLVRSLTRSRMRQAGVRVDFDGQVDSFVLSFLKPGADPRMVARLLALERAGTGRAATAIAFWWRTRFRAPRQDPRVAVERLVRQQLDELDQADVRRDAWMRLHRGLAK